MTIGTRVYGLGAVILGIPAIIFGSFAMLGQPVPHELPGYQILLYAACGLLILAGLAACLPRTAAIGSLALAAFFALFLILLHLPQAAGQPLVWVSYENVAENIVKVLAACWPGPWRRPPGRRARPGSCGSCGPCSAPA